jgi:hypothetical protein
MVTFHETGDPGPPMRLSPWARQRIFRLGSPPAGR